VSSNGASLTVPQLGASPEVLKATFALDGPATLDQVFQVADDFAVVVVTSRHKPSDDDYAKQKQQITLEATKAKQFELKEAFVKSLRKSAQVVMNNPAIDKITEG